MRIKIKNNNLEIRGIKAILFDLDGTLINSLDLHIESFQWILRKLGKEVGNDELDNLMGLTPQDIIRRYFSDLPMEKIWKAAIEKENYLGTIIQEVYVYPGIKEFLSRLKDSNIHPIVISSTHQDLVRKLLDKADLLQFIDVIVSGDEIKNGKPDPEPFRLGLTKIGIDAKYALGIGDSIYDGQSCIGAGIEFIGIKTGKTSYEEFREAGISHVIDNIENLILSDS